ncbi:gustatory receptor [Homalodisca vitripennis]|nr:gustatory receptor [Homalodisca vitripennis]
MIPLYSYFHDIIDGRVTDHALTFHLISFQVVVAVVFLSSVCKYPILIEVFDTLERVYKDLQHKATEVKVIVMFWGICIVATFSATIVQRVVSVMNGTLTVSAAVSSAMHLTKMALLYSSQAALFVHFTHIATSIAKAFRKVTDRIEKEITSNIIERMETTHNLPNVDFTHTTRNMVLTIKKLKNLMNTYWMLCDAVHQANDFYCYQLMAVTFNSFVQVTITCYAFFLHGRDGNMFAMLPEGAWILTHIYYVVVLVNSSTDVTNSAEETSQMICKLINKSNLDPALRKEMAGAVTTYLVILIQFQAKPTST